MSACERPHFTVACATKQVVEADRFPHISVSHLGKERYR